MPAAPTYLPTSYTEAVRILGTKSSKKIGNNTTLERVWGSDKIAVRYHATFIIEFTAEGTVRLFTGGYHTATTKARLDYVASAYSYNVSQRDFTWYLRDRLTGVEVEFFDGVDVAVPLETRRSA